jgi:integrase/recombinase XerC
MRSFFQFLVDAGYLTENPARLIRMGRCSRKIPAYLSRSEIHTLLRSLEKANTPIARRDRLMFSLMLSTGIRLGSLVALNVGDIDLAHSTLHIRGKNGTESAVFLSQPLKRLLKRHVAHRPGHDDEALFVSNRGRRIGVRQVELRLAYWIHIAGIAKQCSVHSLRHTFATCLYEKTGDLRLVQRALGHRRITTTDIYAHMIDSRLRRAVQHLDLLG